MLFRSDVCAALEHKMSSSFKGEFSEFCIFEIQKRNSTAKFVKYGEEIQVCVCVCVCEFGERWGCFSVRWFVCVCVCVFCF